MRNPGDKASDCQHCGGPRIWKHAKADGSSWRQYCRLCHSQRSYRSRNKRRVEYLAQLREKRRTSIDIRAYELWKNAKDRAFRKKVPFNLPRELVASWLSLGLCQATGLRFDLALPTKRLEPMSPTLDRVEAHKGYVVGNVRLVCWIYNRARGNGTDQDVWDFVEAMNAVGISRSA